MRTLAKLRRNHLLANLAFAMSCLVTTSFATSADNRAVKLAIEQGAEYIQGHQLQDGCWQGRGHRLGETALAGLALLAAGQPVDSPAVTAAAQAVRQLAAANWQTYDVSLAVMFLDQLGKNGDFELIRNLGARLAAGQALNGCWTYSLNGSAGVGDNSNTQFAILACWICRRHGVILEDTILKADGYFRSTVNAADGGWGYTPGARSTPTMTCAGLVALAAERGVSIQRSQKAPATEQTARGPQDGPQRELAPDQKDPIVAAALRHLAIQLKQDRIEAQSKSFAGLYFYWSLERVGVIYGLGRIQDVDWYDWGVQRLLRQQRQDGGWGGRDCVDTAFAILFLSRSNVAEDLTRVLGGWEAEGAPAKSPTTDTFLRVEKRRRPSQEDGDDGLGSKPEE